METILSDYLVTYSGQTFQQIADKRIQMPSEIKLLAGTKIYYRLNSKGDNFKVHQLQDAVKHKLFARDKMSYSIFNVQSMALKIACSNTGFTLDFVRKC